MGEVGSLDSRMVVVFRDNVDTLLVLVATPQRAEHS